MIQDLIREGGTGMLFTFAWGFLGLGYAALSAARPTAARLRFVSGLTATTVGAGLASTVAGLIAMSRATGLCAAMGEGCRHGPWRIAVEGAGEAIQNLLVGLVFFTLISFVAAFGRLRLQD